MSDLCRKHGGSSKSDDKCYFCNAPALSGIDAAWDTPGPASACKKPPGPEYTGKSVSYYRVKIDKPTTAGNPPYEAECNDIIEALGMNYAQGNAFKALWRQAAAIKLGLLKQGNNALYDAEKVVFFGERLVTQFTKKD